MKTIDIINLGCSKNLVDAENLFTQLRHNGVNVRLNPDQPDGEIAIINTCGFIGDAKEESVDTILELVQQKSSQPQGQVLVMGCLSERYRQELQKEIPEISGVYGVHDLEQIIADLGFTYHQERTLLRMHSTLPHFAYLKIAEGCDRGCAFCAIPLIRGKQVSKTMEDLTAEAQHLAAQGVKELILISQELTRYGTDLYRKPALAKLVKSLCQVEGIDWVRLHYTYPNHFDDELIALIAREEKVCHYLDMPFQHVNDRVLKMMRRGHSRHDADQLIQKIRQAIPDIALRTTLLVGHPGEDEKAFEELLQWVREIRFDRLGVFTYSHEEGTHAYKNYQDNIPDPVKRKRADQVMALQQQISLEKNEDKVGQTFRVLVDAEEQNHWVGRTQYDSPEIDNEVFIDKSGEHIQVGSFFDVHITAATEFDLIGRVCPA